MKKQVNVALTYLFTFYPEDLGLDDSAHRTALMDYADVEIDNIISEINQAINLTPDNIDIEIYEVKE